MATSIVASILDPAFPAPNYNFAFSEFLKREYRFGIPPTRPLCKADQEGHCPLGNACPDRHKVVRSKDVCKHWLKGLCKKGEHCEFLHEYNLRRMPECTHYARTLSCPNGEECLYQHVDPQAKLPPCPHYERGFCPLGPKCSRKHLRRTICRFYLAGFCPEGRATCKEGIHPRWQEDLPKPTVKGEQPAEEAMMARDEEDEREEKDKMQVAAGGSGGGGGRERDRDWDRETGVRDRDRDRDREWERNKSGGAMGGREGRGQRRGRYGYRRRY